jgi:putative flippase GtrA
VGRDDPARRPAVPGLLRRRRGRGPREPVAYVGLVTIAHVAPLVAATAAFSLAVVHNYVANRWLTFRHHRRGFASQGVRFAIVAMLALGVNLAVLALLLPILGMVGAQVIAICVATPVNFLGNKRWSFAEGVHP